MDAIIAALISAIVALTVGVISYNASRRNVRAEIFQLKFELTRRLTEKLYDKRLDIYPLAFEITDDLRGEYLFSPKVNREDLEVTRQNLLDWNKKNGLVLSNTSIQNFKNLRRIIEKLTKSDMPLTEETLKPIWEAKNQFRTSIRNDLNLLYAEE